MQKAIKKVTRISTVGWRIQFYDGTKQDVTNETAGGRAPLPGDTYEITGKGIRIIPRTS